jgi:hypothetical protein
MEGATEMRAEEKALFESAAEKVGLIDYEW